MFNVNCINFGFLLCVIIAFTFSHPLLNLVNLCDRQDSNFKGCAINETNRLMNVLSRGIRNYVPNFSPLNFSNITYENDFHIELYEGNLNGMKTFRMSDINLEWNDKKWFIKGFLDKLELQSTCKIVSNVSSKYLNGNGSINILMENVDFEGFLFLTFFKKDDNEIYIKYADNKIHLSPRNIRVDLSNVFDDTINGTLLNNYLNSNNTIREKELVPVVEEVLIYFFKRMQQDIGPTIPFKNFFKNYY